MPIERRRLTSFSPDLDPITKDVVLADDNWIPITKGYRTMAGLIAASPPLPGRCLGAFVGRVGNNGPIVVAGTETDLYILEPQGWVAQNVGSAQLAPPDRWRFTQYGQDIIAVNGANRPYVSHNGGTFGPLGGNPPIASLAGATDFSIFLIHPESNEWISSLSDSIWTLDIATETVQAALDSTPGPITAVLAIRGGVALYKEHALYAATFSGAPFFWTFQKISAEVGVPSQETVVEAGDFHYFWGVDNFYRFDGYNLVPIPNRLREFFEADLDKSFEYLIAGRWDEDRSLVFWHYPSVNSGPKGELDKWICINTQTGEWGNGTINFTGCVTDDGNPMTYDRFGTLFGTYNSITPIPGTYNDPFFNGQPPVTTCDVKFKVEAVLAGRLTLSRGLTYDQFGMLYGQYNLIPDIPYSDPIFGASGEELSGLVLSDHTLYVYKGPPTQDSYLTTGDFGDRVNMFEVRRMRPGFALNPGYGWSEVICEGAYVQGTPFELMETVAASPDAFYNVHVTNRLLRFTFHVFSGAIPGSATVSGFTYDQFGALFGQYDLIGNFPYNAPLFGSQQGVVAPFGDAELVDYTIEYELAGEV